MVRQPPSVQGNYCCLANQVSDVTGVYEDQSMVWGELGATCHWRGDFC
jgi:hypothetical protein